MSAKGLLLVNLGSPDAPTPKAVKAYLNRFLMDKYVLDIPAPLRFLLVHGLITPKRSKTSAEAYQKIWTKEGSPLVNYTRGFAKGVGSELSGWSVRWAMRYGQPSLAQVTRDWDVEQVYVVPLYPQYAESSTRTAIEAACASLKGKQVFVLENFFSEPEFIESQSERIESAIQKFRPDHVLLSFHGLPEHHMSKLHPTHCLSEKCCESVSERNRYCYRAQAFMTAAELRKKLPFAPEKIDISFQSRLGRRPWIKPYTDFRVTELAANGIKRLLVSCPSFVADCLETLEEIQIRLREQFISEGGEDLMLAPALNDSPQWIKRFCKMIERPNLKWVST